MADRGRLAKPQPGYTFVTLELNAAQVATLKRVTPLYGDTLEKKAKWALVDWLISHGTPRVWDGRGAPPPSNEVLRHDK